MLPIHDNIPSARRPVAMWGILGATTLIFFLELSLTQNQLLRVFLRYGFVPASFSLAGDPIFTVHKVSGPLSVFTHMFLHSGWFHFLGNMWILWIFGDNVEDVMGHFRFVVFYLVSGVGALLTHFLFNINSFAPVVGASGAISGVMGAYFVLYPHATVRTLIPIFIIPYFIDLPAVVFLGIWFLLQFLSGMASIGAQGGGIAWWAHAGGFILGMFLIQFFKKPELCKQCYGGDVKGRWPGNRGDSARRSNTGWEIYKDDR